MLWWKGSVVFCFFFRRILSRPMTPYSKVVRILSVCCVIFVNSFFFFFCTVQDGGRVLTSSFRSVNSFDCFLFFLTYYEWMEWKKTHKKQTYRTSLQRRDNQCSRPDKSNKEGTTGIWFLKIQSIPRGWSVCSGDQNQTGPWMERTTQQHGFVCFETDSLP